MNTTSVGRARQQAAQQRPLARGEEPPLGAHLVTPRPLYTHHGVHVGQGRVIHYAGLSSGWHAGPVEEISLEQFAAGHGVAVCCDDGARFGGEQVVRRARSRLGEQRYSVLTNNCEHFCEWCVHGESRSRQVESWLPRAAALARDALAGLVFGRAGRAAEAF